MSCKKPKLSTPLGLMVENGRQKMEWIEEREKLTSKLEEANATIARQLIKLNACTCAARNSGLDERPAGPPTLEEDVGQDADSSSTPPQSRRLSTALRRVETRHQQALSSDFGFATLPANFFLDGSEVDKKSIQKLQLKLAVEATATTSNGCIGRRNEKKEVWIPADTAVKLKISASELQKLKKPEICLTLHIMNKIFMTTIHVKSAFQLLRCSVKEVQPGIFSLQLLLKYDVVLKLQTNGKCSASDDFSKDYVQPMCRKREKKSLPLPMGQQVSITVETIDEAPYLALSGIFADTAYDVKKDLSQLVDHSE